MIILSLTEQFKALVLVGVLTVVWTFLPYASCLALEQKQSAQFWVIHNWRDECWHFKEDFIFSVWFMSASWPHLPKSKIMWRISFFLLPDVPSFFPPAPKNHNSGNFPTMVVLPPCSLKGGTSSWYFRRWRRAHWSGFPKPWIAEGLARQLSDAKILIICTVQLNCSSG